MKREEDGTVTRWNVSSVLAFEGKERANIQT